MLICPLKLFQHGIYDQPCNTLSTIEHKLYGFTTYSKYPDSMVHL